MINKSTIKWHYDYIDRDINEGIILFLDQTKALADVNGSEYSAVILR